MEEGGLYIKAHDFEVMLIGEGKQDSDASKFHDRGIRVTVVLWPLAKTLSD